MRRRDFITFIGSVAAWPVGTAAAGAEEAAAADATAPQTERAMHANYFVPGGRIGFERPADIAPWSNSWELLSKDQTLLIAVREALRIDAAWDGRMWDQDDRQALVSSGAMSPTIAYRRFHDRRYGNSADYGADTYVLRDDHWIGQISASTSTLGSSGLSVPGGQIQRWRPVIEAILGSVAVRPPPAASQALAEHRMSLSVDGLNPRFVGDQLVMSLAPPGRLWKRPGSPARAFTRRGSRSCRWAVGRRAQKRSTTHSTATASHQAPELSPVRLAAAWC